MLYRNLRTIALALMMTGFALAPVSAAHADTKIAVVDLQRVLSESNAGKALQKQLEADQKAFQDDVAKQQTSLQAQQDQLNKDTAASKNADEVAQKKADFEKKFIDAKQQVQKKHDVLEKAANASVGDLRNQAAAIIGDIAQKAKIDLVLARQSVIIADKSMDLTDAVIKGLDAKTGGKAAGK